MIQKAWSWALHPPVTGPRAAITIRLMAVTEQDNSLSLGSLTIIARTKQKGE